MPRVSVVVSGDFCRFKLALPSLLSMSKDEVKTSSFDIANRPHFVPHTIPYNVFKFSTVPPVTYHRVTQRVTRS